MDKVTTGMKKKLVFFYKFKYRRFVINWFYKSYASDYNIRHFLYVWYRLHWEREASLLLWKISLISQAMKAQSRSVGFISVK